MTGPLNPKYVIERFVGQGGMGEVFAGRALGVEGFSRPVAIKRLLARFSDERSVLVAEARLTARLSHANIVAVHDLDQDEDGRLFLVMELVEGVDLTSLLCRGALPLPVALFVTCEVLRGLSYAHDLPVPEDPEDPVLGFVHRDVSPSNILLDWYGAVKVTDFGLAKARARATHEASASLFTRGKAAYMSPEQAKGLALDGRSDLYSVGVMLWEMLCGARLFGRSTHGATVRSALVDPIPSPRDRAPGLPRDVEQITTRLLERDRSRRYPTAGAVLEALLACQAYPKNGRELLAALLRERVLAQARQRNGEGASLPRSSSVETASAPPIAPLLVPAEPYPDPPRLGRAWRAVLLALVGGSALALVALLAIRVVSGIDDERAPVAPAADVVAPSVKPPGEPQPRELRAIPAPGEHAPAPSAVAAREPGAPAPTMAPPRRPPIAPSGRASARGRPAREAPDATSRQGIRVLDLRDLALKDPAPDE